MPLFSFKRKVRWLRRDKTRAPPASSPSTFKCSLCEYQFKAEDCFFCCHVNDNGEFNVCPACVVTDTFSFTGREPRPCFLDSRDGRPTFLPAPDISSFQSFILRAGEDPSFRFPPAAKKFLTRIDVPGVPKERVSSENAYSEADISPGPNIMHTVSSNYTFYEELDHQEEIRVVWLHKGQPDDPITIVLHTIESPWYEVPYFAVSYRWGELDETRSIFVHHTANYSYGARRRRHQPQRFTVTANLEIALRGIRREDKDIPLWIDAICINQADLEERASQVSVMANIYSCACSTIVWLGMTEEEEGAVRYIEILADLATNERKRHPDIGTPDALMRYLVQRPVWARGETIEHDEIVKNVAKFFRNPWFTRVWVLQEVFCTAQSVILLKNRGIHPIHWSEVQNAGLYLNAAFLKLKTGVWGLVEPWSKIKGSFDEENGSPVYLPILELLDHVFHRFHATDPRDKIFSLVALARETQGQTDLSPLIQPNYFKSNAQVLIDFTKWCIEHDRTLRVLGYVTYMDRKKTEDLPTWVLSDQPKFEGYGTQLCPAQEFRASGDTQVNLSQLYKETDDRVLYLGGFRLFDVTSAENAAFHMKWQSGGGLHLGDESDSPQNIDAAYWILTNSQRIHGKPAQWCEPVPGCDMCSGQHALDQVLLTITVGGWGPCRNHDYSRGIHQRCKLELKDLYEGLASYWTSYCESHPGLDMEPFCPHVQDILRSCKDDQMKSDFFQMMMAFGATRKSPFTVEGGGAGLGPPGIQKGDVVVVLFGGNTPYVLRPRHHAQECDEQEEWEFVGECYMTGLMDGKVVEGKMERQEPPEVFKLC